MYRYIIYIHISPPLVHANPHTRWLNEAGDSQIHRSLFIYIVKRPAYTCMKRDLHIPIYMKRDLYICTHTP